MTYIIYKIENIETGKVYIGKTSNKLNRRWTEHKSRLRTKTGYCDLFIEEFHKYGEDSFNISTIETVYNEQEASLKEKQYIKLFNTITPNGYNSQSGGDYGYKNSEEIKKKMSITRKGRKHSEEHKNNISKSISGENNPMYGRKHSDETKKKISKTKLNNYPTISNNGFKPNGKRNYALRYKGKELKKSINKEFLQSLIDSREYLELYKEKYGE